MMGARAPLRDDLFTLPTVTPHPLFRASHTCEWRSVCCCCRIWWAWGTKEVLCERWRAPAPRVMCKVCLAPLSAARSPAPPGLRRARSRPLGLGFALSYLRWCRRFTTAPCVLFGWLHCSHTEVRHNAEPSHKYEVAQSTEYTVPHAAPSHATPNTRNTQVSTADSRQ